MVPVSTNKVFCPFPKGGTLVDLPCHKVKAISPILCEAMGCPHVKFPGQVLPLASTSRVGRENLTNAHSIFAPLGKLETFAKITTACNCIVCPLNEKVLPSPVEFPAQSMTVNHPIRVDEYLEDHVCQAPTHVQHTSTYAITSHDEPLNWPRLVLMVKDQPQ